MKNYWIIALLISMSACTQSPDDPMSKKDTEEVASPAMNTKDFFNNALAEDAKNGKSYTDKYFHVLTDNSTVFSDEKGQELYKLKRGTVYSLVPTTKSKEGFIAIETDGAIGYIPVKSNHFQQEVKGMKYPLFGVVEEENAFATYYDSETSSDKKITLPVGSVYLYVLMKDQAYINIQIPDSDEYVTAEYCCKVNIIQSQDHAKLLSQYKTKLKSVLDFN